MRRHRSAAGLLVLLLVGAAILDPVSARGLRSQEQKQQQQKQQGPDAASPAAATPASTATAAPASSKGVPLPPQPPQTVDEDKEDAAALLAYSKQRQQLEGLHEDMLVTLAVKEQRQQLNGLHEAMVQELGGAEDSKRSLFVAQGDAGGRRLQFGLPGIGGGIPGVGGIGGIGGIPGGGGVGGIGGFGMGSLYGAARMGAEALRQGAYTAVELARMKDEYERRCALGKYKDSAPVKRHLQQLLAEAGRAMYSGAMSYAKDAPCPTPEQRAEYERMYQQAMGAKDKALASLAAQGDAIAQEQAARVVLQRQTRQAPAPRVLQEQQKRPVPVYNGADILARQQQLLDAYGAAPRSEVAAALLRRAGAGAGAGGDGGNTFADFLDSDPIGGALRRAGYRQQGAGLGAGLGAAGGLGNDVDDVLDGEDEEDDDATLESLMGPMRLGESREARHKRKQELRAQRKAARLARKAERKARRHHGAGANQH